MKIKKLNLANDILKILQQNGFEAFIVGGAVRDYYLNLPFVDIDIITNALTLDLMKIFKINSNNIKHGSCNVCFKNSQFDITTYRIEEKYKNHRHPTKIIFTNDVKKDLLRRDFTINSLLMDDKKNIIDYLGGLSDIKNSIIKTIKDPEEKFQEDSVRILRTCYFQAKLCFEIEINTKKALKKQSYLLKKISKDRILQEFIKIISQKHFYKSLITIKETNIIDFLKGLSQGINFCIENKLKKINKDIFFSLSLILNKKMFNYFNFSKKDQKLYQTVEFLFNKKKLDIKWSLFKYGLEICLLTNKINYLFKKEKNETQKIKIIYKNLIIKKNSDLKISSIEILKIMQISPGLWLNNLKQQIIKLVLDEKIINSKKNLLNYVRKIKKRSD
ncbi:poly(A)polymerase [Candidatus Phytoplasma mali]|uniref:Poly(A)polymerase n=1 Tax=Phytoplasma mali (strain AT) TaxID=482235 RepID=B3QZN8_PHYMT|nr:CCA tRNA nucleotidyltransferase [Candidatus Phytoplasma mali]CAP18425.1 poly(A)polymerase [Candidatus Phytoplasma mali]